MPSYYWGPNRLRCILWHFHSSFNRVAPLPHICEGKSGESKCTPASCALRLDQWDESSHSETFRSLSTALKCVYWPTDGVFEGAVLLFCRFDQWVSNKWIKTSHPELGGGGGVWTACNLRLPSAYKMQGNTSVHISSGCITFPPNPRLLRAVCHTSQQSCWVDERWCVVGIETPSYCRD